MSLFDSLQNNVMSRLQADPAAMLKTAGYTIPSGMTNPQQIIQHLIQSGQVSNPRVQALMRMMGK